MANFVKSSPHSGSGDRLRVAGQAKPAVAPPEPATEVRLIRLSKPANDNPKPLAARLRWWLPLAAFAIAAVLWLALR